ncbi:hypothetical protein V6N13_103658 [Hibiscus sabdariffa]
MDENSVCGKSLPVSIAFLLCSNLTSFDYLRYWLLEIEDLYCLYFPLRCYLRPPSAIIDVKFVHKSLAVGSGTSF